MSEVAISVENVSKKYRLFDSARDRLKEALHPFSKHYHREFWALKGVSFQVPRGQTIGILGRNGSGKSTLLQIIAGVMQATSGVIQANGRVSALLELGAGFNPEFSGRENVTFQAQIMGFSRPEINRLIPEVEEFADIGDFFDQPVKIYSSGMFVRVAFAIASTVNPDILIIDEALAVGDVRFQRKCLLRIEKIRTNGAAIIFVSHSLDAVTSLCSRALILENGGIVADGDPKIVVEKYLDILFSESEAGLKAQEADQEIAQDATVATGDDNRLNSDPFFSIHTNDSAASLPTRSGFNRHEVRTVNGAAAILDFLIVADGRADVACIDAGTAVKIFMKVRFATEVSQPIIGFELKTDKGVTITGSNTFLAKTQLRSVGKGEIKIYQIDFDTSLNHGDYFIDLGVAKFDGTPGGCILDVRRSVIHLTVNRMTEKNFNGIVDIGFGFTEVDR